MEWKEVGLSSTSKENDKYVVIGKGKIKLSRVACNLVNGFESCSYVSFYRAKKDRVYFVGLKFSKTKGENTYIVSHLQSNTFGAAINAKDIIHSLYGEEALSSKYTKHSITTIDDEPNMIVVYYNYVNNYYLNNDSSKKVRTNHIGSIVNEEWLVVSSSKIDENGKLTPTYLLRNVNTGEEIRISTRGLADIKRGCTTVENIKLCRKIGIKTYRAMKASEKKKRIKNLVNK